MILLEIVINGQPPKRIGIRHSGVVSSVLSIVSNLRSSQKEHAILFEVGGVVNQSKGHKEYLRWLEESLHVGDSILIKVCNGNKSDQPIYTRTETPSDARVAKKKYLTQVAKEISKNVKRDKVNPK